MIDVLTQWGYTPETCRPPTAGAPPASCSSPTARSSPWPSTNPAVVCGIHRGLIAGSMEQFGEPDTEVGLEPFVGPATLCRARHHPIPFRDKTPGTATKEPA
jgi:hypothetical protein